MAYVYQVDFGLNPEQMSELQIGASLERALGYLRTLLPSSVGYVTSRAMYSLYDPDRIHVVLMSVWETWEDLLAHGSSSLAEQKILKEFEPHVTLDALATTAYREVD